MRNDMIGLAKTFEPNVTDLKSLYGFRLLLKKRMAEYKKVLGEDIDPEQAKHILWNVLDDRSMEIATNAELNKKSYKDLYEHIDLRYKIPFGHLNYTSNSPDDPMGLALITPPGESQRAVQEVGGGAVPIVEPEAGAIEFSGWELGAVGKGKGKGSGVCHTCGGEGHVARDCPS